MRRVPVPGGLLLWRRLAVGLPLSWLLAVSRSSICSLLLLVRSPLGRVGRIVVLLLLIVSRPGRCMLVSLRDNISVDSFRAHS